MQSTIGQQLIKARQKMGITLSQAAEATKIRGDFLLQFENNNFAFELPEIYKRGFLKLYARHLRLNVDEIIAEYDHEHKREMDDATQGARALLTRIETKRQEDDAIEEADALEQSKEIGESSSFAQKFLNPESLQAKIWMRRGIVLATIGLIFWGSFALFSPKPNAEINPELTSSAKTPQAAERIELIALADVHVVVRQESDHQKLFSGTLTKGQHVPLEKTGPIKIRFSDGEGLIIEKNGQQYSMNAKGMGVRLFE
jgi:cytoskeleton protein RodZ